MLELVFLALCFSGPSYTDAASNVGKTFFQTFHNQIIPATYSFILTTEADQCSVIITVDNPPVASYPVPITNTQATLYTMSVANNVGIKLDAPCDFSVFGWNFVLGSVGGWMALPVEALGCEYVVLGVPYWNVPNATQLSIIASSDSTICTTTFPNGDQDTFSLISNKGRYYSNSTDLTGTRVKCNNKVTVISGHECAKIPEGCGWCDHAVEQLPPTSSFGRNFALVPLTHGCAAKPTCCTDQTFCAKCSEMFRIVAAEDNTQVNVHGTETTDTFVLQAGEAKFILLSQTEVAHVITSKPTLVGHYSNGAVFQGDYTNDPSFAVVAPIENYRQQYKSISCLPNFASNFVTLVAPKDSISQSQLLIDGQAIPTSVVGSPIPDTDYAAFRFSVACTSGPIPISIEHTQSSKFGLFLYGFDTIPNSMTYGFPGGMELNVDGCCSKPKIDVAGTKSSQACNLADADITFDTPTPFSDPACCMGPSSFTFLDDNPSSETCKKKNQRTWTLKDACGKSVSAQQISTVEQALDSYDLPATVEFSGKCSSIYGSNVTGVPKLKQDCKTTTSITFSDVTDYATYVERTWTIREACSTNPLTLKQIISCSPDTTMASSTTTTTVPNIPPASTTAAATCQQPRISVSQSTKAVKKCKIPESPDTYFDEPTTISDDACCRKPASLTYSDSFDSSNDCGKTWIRIWNLTDGCGKSSIATQTVDVQQSPDVYKDLKDTNYNGQCSDLKNSKLSTEQIGKPILKKNCKQSKEPEFEDAVYDGYVKRTWTIDQKCGGGITLEQTITCENHAVTPKEPKQCDDKKKKKCCKKKCKCKKGKKRCNKRKCCKHKCRCSRD